MRPKWELNVGNKILQAIWCVCSAPWTASEWLRWSVSAWWISLSDYSSSVQRNDWTAPFAARFLLFLVIHQGIKVEGSKTASSEWIAFLLHKWPVWMSIIGHASVIKNWTLAQFGVKLQWLRSHVRESFNMPVNTLIRFLKSEKSREGWYHCCVCVLEAS